MLMTASLAIGTYLRLNRRLPPASRVPLGGPVRASRVPLGGPVRASRVPLGGPVCASRVPLPDVVHAECSFPALVDTGAGGRPVHRTPGAHKVSETRRRACRDPTVAWRCWPSRRFSPAKRRNEHRTCIAGSGRLTRDV